MWRSWLGECAHRRDAVFLQRSYSVPIRDVRKSIALAIVTINMVVIIWPWLSGGGISGVHTSGDPLTSVGRIYLISTRSSVDCANLR